MNRSSRWSVAAAALILVTLTPSLSSCDAAGIGSFELLREPVSFSFLFDGSAVSPGQPFVVSSAQTRNILSLVQARGFTAADITSARIVGTTEVYVATPTDGQITRFSSVEVRALQNGQTGQLMLSGDGFPATGSRGSLQVRATQITGLVAGGAFSTQMELVTNQPLRDRPYTLVVTFDVVVDVEG